MWAEGLAHSLRRLADTPTHAPHHPSSGKCGPQPQDTTLHPAGRLLPKTPETNECWRGRGEAGTLVRCRWGCERVQPLGTTVCGSSKEVKTVFPYDPATPLQGKNPKEWKEGTEEMSVRPCSQSVIHGGSGWETPVWTDRRMDGQVKCDPSTLAGRTL